MKSVLLILTLLMINQESRITICNFNEEIGTSNWNVVDDGVMGGLSQGSLVLSEAGNALYTGIVRTENNGGFSSIRHNFKTLNISEFKTLCIRVKGDGKSYQFRIKEDRSERFSYIQTFKTNGEWETINIPLKDFYASFRGRTLDKPNFLGNSIEEIAILIGNKVKESFKLEIAEIFLK